MRSDLRYSAAAYCGARECVNFCWAVALEGHLHLFFKWAAVLAARGCRGSRVWLQQNGAFPLQHRQCLQMVHTPDETSTLRYMARHTIERPIERRREVQVSDIHTATTSHHADSHDECTSSRVLVDLLCIEV